MFRVGVLRCLILVTVGWLFAGGVWAQPKKPLEAEQILSSYDWLDNCDYAWYGANIPLLDTPDSELNQTYYYRWELITKHVVYGSPDDGYAFTEFLDRPFWSGTYGAISCPAGHQLYELRWLRDPVWAEDYMNYWLQVPGAEPRRYSCWIADASWGVHQVHPHGDRIARQYEGLVKNYELWRDRHWDQARGLFWQTGHDDGMEWNINSRQTSDEIRGGPGFRPTLNAYLWADARALARMARVAGHDQNASKWERFAQQLKESMQDALWDPQREFFFHQARGDEELDGHVVRAGSLTYQTGRFAGSPHGRELIGYVPWQFSMPDPGFEVAWKFLMDSNYFAAKYGPTTVERRDPLFKVQTRCCMWSGMSWPYATSQTLKAMANVLQFYEQSHVTRDDYYRLLTTFSLSHRKEGRPYLAEACHPDTGSWEGHDSYNHSEHYFHSSFVDLVLTGLIGLQPQDDDRLVIDPLVPTAWDYFLVQDIPYKGRRIAVAFDRTGERYGMGSGFQVWVDDDPAIQLDHPVRVEIPVTPQTVTRLADTDRLRNFAVNNTGRKFPRPLASIDPDETRPDAAFDGQYWYLVRPGNRWTNLGSQREMDWIGVDFGIERQVEQVVIYFLDDGPNSSIRPPEEYWIEIWRDEQWTRLDVKSQQPPRATGRMANRVDFDPAMTSRLRVAARGQPISATFWGISELETWGRSPIPVPHPEEARNLARRDPQQTFPRATASHTSRYDRVHELNDGIIRQRPGGSRNRWTAYESPNERDWVQIDFDQRIEFGRVELYFYDDGGGVRLPRAVTVSVQENDDTAWREIRQWEGGEFRARGPTVFEFDTVAARRLRIEFLHHPAGKTGVSEIEVYRDDP